MFLRTGCSQYLAKVGFKIMYYFKFQIPTNADGTRITYSPGWHGSMPRCPKDTTVLMYNDKEGYGIAQSQDSFLPPEVTVMPEEDALKDVKKFKDKPEKGIYTGLSVVTRWDDEEKERQLILESDRKKREDEALIEHQKQVDIGQANIAQELADKEAREKPIDQPVEPVIDEVTGEVKEPLRMAVVSTSFVSCTECHKPFAVLKRYANNSVSIYSIDAGREMIKGIICKNINITCPMGHKVKVTTVTNEAVN